MPQPRRLDIAIVGAAAWVLAVVNNILDIVEASSLSVAKASYGLSLAACVLDALAIVSILAFALQYAWTGTGVMGIAARPKIVMTAFVIVQSTIALAVSLASIVNIKRRTTELNSLHFRTPVANWDGQFRGHVVVWIFACLGQMILFSTPLWDSHGRKSISCRDSALRASVMSQTQPSKRLVGRRSTLPSQLTSPAFSLRSSNSFKSCKDSLYHMVRPASSRTKPARDSQAAQSDGVPLDNITADDCFDSSAADAQNQVSTLQSAAAPSSLTTAATIVPVRRTMLEPIPGSRSASLACTLDGSLAVSTDDDSRDDSQPHEEDDNCEDDNLPSPPRMMPDLSRPPSPAVSEAHIHPLFRTESPTPAPAATPGTSIVASPFSNQVITYSSRSYNRIRSNSNLSRAASPGALSPSQSYASLRGASGRSRSSSASSRAVTPCLTDAAPHLAMVRKSMSDARR